MPKEKGETASKIIDERSRIARLKEAGKPVLLPDNPAPFLTDWLIEAGPMVPAGMGLSALSWRDIAAWAEATGRCLEPWQALMVRRLSSEYVSAFHRAGEAGCPSPLGQSEEDDGQAPDLENRLRDALMAMTNPRARPMPKPHMKG